MTDYTGRTLGKYHLQERLGRGGMAEVYRAYQAGLERFVAIKILHPHLTEAPDFVGRFRREAQAVAQLHHPHIVQVFDFDVQDDLHYMVMEFVPGASLKARLDELYRRGQRLPIADVLSLFRALLDAAGYAHAGGIVHRDLKPANVMIDPSGRQVLTDFGIAKIVGAAKFTETGTSVGTPHYMSPEQGQGESGDARSDLYSLGVMLFECLAGQVPFDGDTSVAVLLKHISAPIPSLTKLRPELPPAVDQFVTKALAKEPQERYQSAAEMLKALEKLKLGAEATTEAPARSVPAAASTPSRVRPATVQRPSRRVLAWGAGIMALVVIAIAASLFIPRLFGPSASGDALATAQAHAAAGKYQLAADTYTAILAQNSDDVPALLGRALAFEQLSQITDALADVEHVISVAPADPRGYDERARLNLQYGLAADPALALDDLNRAVSLAPASARPHFVRGWALLNFALSAGARSPQAALPDLEKAAGLEPQTAEFQFTLAQAYLLAGRPVEALTPANRAVELQPDSALHHQLRAHIQFALDDYHAAIDDLTAALGLENSDEQLAALHLERGFLSFALGDSSAALADLEQAERNNPAAVLAPVLRALLDPSAPRPDSNQLTELASLAPDDPIWQAMVTAVSKQ